MVSVIKAMHNMFKGGDGFCFMPHAAGPQLPFAMLTLLLSGHASTARWKTVRVADASLATLIIQNASGYNTSASGLAFDLDTLIGRIPTSCNDCIRQEHRFNRYVL
jgi:hypothetical protein